MILALLLLLTRTGFPSIACAQAWTELASGTFNALNSVSFSDSLTGYAGGDNGTILRTTNGGTTWAPRTALAFHNIIRKIIAVKPESVFVMVYDSWYNATYVLASSDSGKTWIPHLQYLPGSRFGLSFIDTHYGVALSTDWLYRTTDAGITWQPLPTPYAYLSDISFSDARHGMTCGVLGNIFVTGDSGNTWTASSAGNTNYFSHIRMLDSLHAVMISSQGVYSTSDGGGTWQQTLSDGRNYTDITLFDPNNIVLTSVGAVAWTSDGGASWITCYGSSLQSAAILRPGRVIVATSSGKMLRSIYPLVSIPPVTLSWPLNGETDLPLDDFTATATTVTPRWHPYPLRDLSGFAFDFEFGEDSSSWTGGMSTTVTHATINDTAATFGLNDSVTYYWRMRPSFSNVPSDSIPWSPIWKFTTPELRKISVRTIQELPLATLLKLDTLQVHDNGYPASYRQTSPLWNHWASVTVRCVVPPAMFSPSAPTMFVCDTTANDSGWHGILVKPHPDVPLAPEFLQAKAGDLLHIVGQVTEEPSQIGDPNSMTEFLAQSVSIVQSAPPSRHAIPLSVASIHHGAHPNDSTIYSSAEQYEGMYIELHNVTVTATATADDGSFTVADDLGNTILTADLSTWFTLRPHRDSLSTFSLPVFGARLDTLRGMLWTTGNTDVPANDWGFRLVPVFPGDISYAQQQNGIIEGIVFNDDNRNQVRDPGEAAAGGWNIELGGAGRSLATSSAAGVFQFKGLAAGAYTVRVPDNQHVPFQVSSPQSRTDSVAIAAHEEIGNINFAVYYPWDWIEGKVFYDVNENGVKEPTEAPIVHALVRLQGAVTESTWTDSLGHYAFHHLLEGESTVSTFQDPPWEVIPLTERDGVRYTFYDLGQLKSNFDFGVHHIPERTRIHVMVHDNTQYLRQELWWGVRPGATDGIGGADGHASNFDISEGESEIPPRAFAQFLGLFDARFMDPGNTVGYFGYGSWTDMRNFFSASQVNTYRIGILPGYSSGGDYPITLAWSRDSVNSNYAGAVTMTDGHGTIFDMKQMDSVVVTDPAIQFLTVSASRPNLSQHFVIQWNLISLPEEPGSPSTKLIFPTAASNAFLYNPASSYVREDTVTSGPGYWLKFSRGLDTFPRLGTPRLTDTLALSSGWNLIGTLSTPVDARSVVTSPPGLVGTFYTYDGHYIIADSLLPEFGYWVKSKQAGTLILSAGAPAQIAKERRSSDPSQANVLTIADAGGNAEKLYFGISGIDEDELPPVPPEGVYDARFTSNRHGELVGENETKTVGLKVSSAVYPLKISWDLKGNCTASLLIDGKKIPLRGTGSVEIAAEGASLALELTGTPDVPREFALEQNFPNPFNPSTVIRYNLPVRQDNVLSYTVSLRIYNLLGQVVATLSDDVEEAGYKSVEWHANNVASGMYFYRLEATASGGEKFTAVKKMILVR